MDVRSRSSGAGQVRTKSWRSLNTNRSGQSNDRPHIDMKSLTNLIRLVLRRPDLSVWYSVNHPVTPLFKLQAFQFPSYTE